jgi:hypothetical protein
MKVKSFLGALVLQHSESDKGVQDGFLFWHRPPKRYGTIDEHTTFSKIHDETNEGKHYAVVSLLYNHLRYWCSFTCSLKRVDCLHGSVRTYIWMSASKDIFLLIFSWNCAGYDDVFLQEEKDGWDLEFLV